MEEKLISIIVAAYNIEDFLGRCLESILAQTYKNLQIIVVDDGSTDNTASICDEYAKRDSRIILVHQKNSGLSGARNTALKLAEGEYIGYVDGDDYIEPDMYEKMLKACLDTEAQVAVCGYTLITADGTKIESTDSGSNSNIYMVRDELIETYISDNKPFHIYNSVWSKLFKRELVENMVFPLNQNSEDIVYTMKAFIGCTGCVFVDYPLYFYVSDRNGSIMNADEKLEKRRFDDELPFWKEQTRLLREANLNYLADLSEYYLYKRELYYYLDFINRKMPEAAKRLYELIKGEKNRIGEIYSMNFVTKGDKARMKVFLNSPQIYAGVSGLYDSVVVPFKGLF